MASRNSEVNFNKNYMLLYVPLLFIKEAIARPQLLRSVLFLMCSVVSLPCSIVCLPRAPPEILSRMSTSMTSRTEIPQGLCPIKGLRETRFLLCQKQSLSCEIHIKVQLMCNCFTVQYCDMFSSLRCRVILIVFCSI